MFFKVLASYLAKLESTASRNSMVEILAELFAQTPASEIDKVTYLIQGRVAPLYEAVEFGMADKMVIKAIAKAYEMADEEILTLYKKSGDLGTTVEQLNKSNKASNSNKSNKTVEEIFLKLKLITGTSGEGSVEKKVTILADLLKSVDTMSAKYIVRIPIDKLRLGFSDATMLEGLSWMLDGTKKHKPVMEAAYNIRPDLGYIARTVREISLSSSLSLRKLEGTMPKLGTPIMVMRAERLVTAKEILEKTGGKCAVEPKLDGLRTQLHLSNKLPASHLINSAALSGSQSRDSLPSQIRNSARYQPEHFVALYSRGMENVTLMYPDLVEAARKEINADEVILDGEAIGFDPKTGKYVGFQQTTQRKRKYDVEAFSKSIPVKLVVYDCLFYNGESLINRTYKERREIVEKLLKRHSGGQRPIESHKRDPIAMLQDDNKIIIPAEMEVVSEPARLKEFFDICVNKGLEGIMAKKLDGVYQAGARGWNWIKLKNALDSIDAVVMGYDYGQGKRNQFGIGAFLVGVYDKKSDSYKTISKIGTGLTDDEWRELVKRTKQWIVKDQPKNYDVNKLMNCDVWIKPKVVGVFVSNELTKSPMHTAGFAMRFPRLEIWRDDKQPEDATSLKEIAEMVGLQHA